MTAIVLVAPYVPPVPPRDPWQGLRFVWEGADGSRWEMQHPSGVRLRPGVRGLTMPPFDQYTSRNAAGHGQRLRGYSAAPRDVFWPVQVWQDEDDIRWLEYDAAFWASLSPERPGTWTVEHPAGTARHLRLRLVDDGDHAWAMRPGAIGWQNYAVTLVADQPFWEGDPVSSPVWGQDESVREFIPAEGAPPFYLSGASTFGSASLTNPGDVESPLVWTVTGPTTNVTLTVGSDVIGVPFPLLEGQTLVIDTGVPRAQLGTVVDGVLVNSTDVTGQISPAGFAPVPAGGTVPLGISMSGTGTVQASFVPHFFRAW